jgi:hypothetical protein
VSKRRTSNTNQDTTSLQRQMFSILSGRSARDISTDDRPKVQESGCQHKVMSTVKVPHPKYGDKVPHFKQAVVDDENCECRVASRALVAAAKQQQVTVPKDGAKCCAVTKSGTNCTRKAVADGYCKQHGG